MSDGDGPHHAVIAARSLAAPIQVSIGLRALRF